MTTAPILFAVALAFTPQDASTAYSVASRLVERHTPRDSGTPGALAAARFIKNETESVASSGRFSCVIDEFVECGTTYRNIVGECVASESCEWVVLVSHYDTKACSGCPGANDGASTAGLLVALAGAVVRADGAMPFNFQFVWTDGEECAGARYTRFDGLAGSRHAAADLARSGRKVRAVICLDMLGDADLRISLPSNSSGGLRKIAFAAARSAGVDIRDFDGVVTDDHAPYLSLGFDAVDLIDFEYGPRPGANSWWHTPHDTIDKISEKSLLKAGRMVAEMVALFGKEPR